MSPEIVEGALDAAEKRTPLVPLVPAPHRADIHHAQRSPRVRPDPGDGGELLRFGATADDMNLAPVLLALPAAHGVCVPLRYVHDGVGRADVTVLQAAGVAVMEIGRERGMHVGATVRVAEAVDEGNAGLVLEPRAGDAGP